MDIIPNLLRNMRLHLVGSVVFITLLVALPGYLEAQTSDTLIREIARIEARLDRLKGEDSSSARLEVRRLKVVLDEKRKILDETRRKESSSLALKDLGKAVPIDGIQYLRDTFRFVMSTSEAKGDGTWQETQEAWGFIGRIMTQRVRGQLVQVSGYICIDTYAERVLDYERTFDVVPHSYIGNPTEAKVCFSREDCPRTPVTSYDRRNKSLIPVFKLAARDALRPSDMDVIKPFRCAGATHHEGPHGWSEVKVEGVLDGGFRLDCGFYSGCMTVTHFFLKDWMLISGNE